MNQHFYLGALRRQHYVVRRNGQEMAVSGVFKSLRTRPLGPQILQPMLAKHHI
jgi:hypothetical protein